MSSLRVERTSPEALALNAGPAVSRRSSRPSIPRRLLRDKVIAASVLILVVIAVCAAVPGGLAPFDPQQQSLRNRLEMPLTETSDGRHWLGTDALGRDILSRIIFGARVSMLVALVSVGIAGTLGVSLGLISGYAGGLVDDVIGWVTNVQLSFPFLLLAVAVAAVLGSGLRNVIIVLSVTTWVVYARVVRSEVLALRTREYVEAAHVFGAGPARILVRHILPNIITPLIVISTFEVARIIIAEASLSFLGLGAGASQISWGTMLADGRKELATSWWVATMPGIAIMLTVLAVNILGDWLRDELDPRAARE